tara:strand:+ start:909 stop:1046 length:138 start_codon:yes stop_codon:yes gene_type:complete
LTALVIVWICSDICSQSKNLSDAFVTGTGAGGAPAHEAINKNNVR